MGYKLLVVDDSTTVRAMLLKCLRMGDVPVESVHEAGNGKEALALLEEHRVDLIFTDINMPEMNGLEFIEHLSEDERHNAIPIVIVSTDTIEARRDSLEAKGVRGYLRKPFTPEGMVSVVQQVMGD